MGRRAPVVGTMVELSVALGASASACWEKLVVGGVCMPAVAEMAAEGGRVTERMTDSMICRVDPKKM